jgi:hypothetical protein
MINQCLSILFEHLRANDIPDPLAQSFTLAALWDDLATIAGETLPVGVQYYRAGADCWAPPVLSADERIGLAPAALTAQELHLALIARSCFNDFDGACVVADLRAHPDYWVAALMVNANLDVLLRDLARDAYQVDTLNLATTTPHVSVLLDCAKRWRATSVHRCGPGLPFGFGGWTREGVVLRLWWD